MKRTVPLFTLQQPRNTAQTRTTKFRARGEKLVTQALAGRFELWSTRSTRKQTRKLIGDKLLDALTEEPGWDLRGVDRWLVLFNEKSNHANRVRTLQAFYERALLLRRLFGA